MSELERTFSQDEVNRIVSERLKSEREKFTREVQAKEAELTRREARMKTRDEWMQKGLPVELLECLADDKAEQAESILSKLKESHSESKGGFGGNKDSAMVQRPDNNETAEIRKRMGL